jgi:hypothetical protein
MNQFLAIKPYPQVKALVLAGSKGYFIARTGYITIILPDAAVEAEFPGVAAFDDLPPGFRTTFSREWEEDFHKTVAPFLIRSDLSDQPAR